MLLRRWSGNICLVEGAGFEPAKPFRTPDLQSGGFNHSPTPPGRRIFAHLKVSAQSWVATISAPFSAGTCSSGNRSGVRTGVVNLQRAPEGIRTPNLSITNRPRFHCATGASRTLAADSTIMRMTPQKAPRSRGHFVTRNPLKLYKLGLGKSIELTLRVYDFWRPHPQSPSS